MVAGQCVLVAIGAQCNTQNFILSENMLITFKNSKLVVKSYMKRTNVRG